MKEVNNMQEKIIKNIVKGLNYNMKKTKKNLKLRG